MVVTFTERLRLHMIKHVFNVGCSKVWRIWKMLDHQTMVSHFLVHYLLLQLSNILVYPWHPNQGSCKQTNDQVRPCTSVVCSFFPPSATSHLFGGELRPLHSAELNQTSSRVEKWLNVTTVFDGYKVSWWQLMLGLPTCVCFEEHLCHQFALNFFDKWPLLLTLHDSWRDGVWFILFVAGDFVFLVESQKILFCLIQSCLWSLMQSSVCLISHEWTVSCHSTYTCTFQALLLCWWGVKTCSISRVFAWLWWQCCSLQLHTYWWQCLPKCPFL